jgi:hypothetical protein
MIVSVGGRIIFQELQQMPAEAAELRVGRIRQNAICARIDFVSSVSYKAEFCKII